MDITSEIILCRVCLATDVKMYDMFTYKIKNIYECLMNTNIPFTDCQHRHICIYCAILLIKFSKFKEKCLASQDWLKNTELKHNEISSNSLKTASLQTQLPYNIYQTDSIDIPPIKLEYNIYYENEYLDDKIEYTDDKTQYIDDKTQYIDDKNQYIDDKTQYIHDKNEYQNIDDKALNDDNLQDNDDYLNSSDGFNSDEEPLSKKKGKKLQKKKCKDYVEDKQADIDVVVLSKEEQIKEIEDRKTSYNYINSYYKCQYCFKGFVTEGTYKNHMIRHDPSSGTFVCDICNTRWPELRALRAHVLVSHKRKYICRLCNNISRNLHKAKEHQNWHNGFKFVCKICGAVFNKSTTHLTHLRSKHPSQHEHTCDKCGEPFISEVGLRMHVKKAHKHTKKTTFQCIICKVQFANKEALTKHGSFDISCSDSKLMPCVKCGENFQEENALKIHMKGHQKADAVDCQFCDRSFSNERTFAVHYQRFHVGKLKCKVHSVKKQDLVCEMCGVRCISKTMLLYHQRTHTGEKPYQCTECPKTFRIYQSLQIHLRTHTGECPFKCTQCPKAFKHKAGLNRHNRVHTGAKPYSCPHCNKSFSQSNSMKLHISTVHLKMPAPYKNRAKNRPVIDSVESV